MAQPQTVLDLFRQTKEDWLLGARKTAQDLLFKRDKITIDDVLMVYPFPSYLHRNTIGSVFKVDVFRPIGYTMARSPQSHKHIIRIWELKDEFYPQSMLAYRRRAQEGYENE